MTAPSNGDSCNKNLANRAVPHMRQSQYSTPKHTPVEILTSDTLDAVFGFRMRVETIEGKPFALHQL